MTLRYLSPRFAYPCNGLLLLFVLFVIAQLLLQSRHRQPRKLGFIDIEAFATHRENPSLPHLARAAGAGRRMFCCGRRLRGLLVDCSDGSIIRRLQLIIFN